MRKYYIFHIQKESYSVYFHAVNILYKTLENLYRMKKNDLDYGISIYRQICEFFPVDLLEQSIKGKYPAPLWHRHKTYISEIKTVVALHPSCIIIESYHNFSPLLTFLHYYSPRLFVCDFENEDYFWLNNYVTHRI